MKWIFYVLVFIYMFYRTVYGKIILPTIHKETWSLSIDPIDYGQNGNYFDAGKRITIVCKGGSKNQKVEWVNPDGETVPRGIQNRVYTQEHFVASHNARMPALLLVLSFAAVEDTGVWECRSGDVKREVSICVIEPSSFVDTLTEVTVDQGRSITLSCQARGEPEPRLVWYRNGEIITDDPRSSKYELMTQYHSQGFTGLLTILSVESEDDGEYICEATQESPRDEACSATAQMNITLHVNPRSGVKSCTIVWNPERVRGRDALGRFEKASIPVLEYTCEIKLGMKRSVGEPKLDINSASEEAKKDAPEFHGGNQTALVPGQENKSVDLVCAASAYPTATYRWFKENGEILSEYPRDAILLQNDGTEAVLTLTANSSTFGHRFRCRATNEYGDVEKVFSLVSLETPRRPDEIIVEYVDHETLDMYARWKGDVSFPVDHMKVQYLKMESLRKKGIPREIDWKKATETDFKTDYYDLINEEKTGLRIFLASLEESTEYWIRMRAVNEAGSSPWTKPILASTIEKSEESDEEDMEETPEEELDENGEPKSASLSDSTFYGVFFAGGIIVIAVGCMLIMKMV